MLIDLGKKITKGLFPYIFDNNISSTKQEKVVSPKQLPSSSRLQGGKSLHEDIEVIPNHSHKSKKTLQEFKYNITSSSSTELKSKLKYNDYSKEEQQEGEDTVILDKFREKEAKIVEQRRPRRMRSVPIIDEEDYLEKDGNNNVKTSKMKNKSNNLRYQRYYQKNNNEEDENNEVTGYRYKKDPRFRYDNTEDYVKDITSRRKMRNYKNFNDIPEYKKKYLNVKQVNPIDNIANKYSDYINFKNPNHYLYKDVIPQHYKNFTNISNFNSNMRRRAVRNFQNNNYVNYKY